MDKELKHTDVEKYLKKLKASVTREECWSCECFQGFLIQLEIDSSIDISDLIKPLKVSNAELHSCLGCKPCSPGELFSSYSYCKSCK